MEWNGWNRTAGIKWSKIAVHMCSLTHAMFAAVNNGGHSTCRYWLREHYKAKQLRLLSCSTVYYYPSKLNCTVAVKVVTIIVKSPEAIVRK